jgi:single-strand DNA-binding protein
MINKVTLLGHLGKDPIIRRTEAGIPVAMFSMATSETYKDKDGNKQEKTEWHNIVAWRSWAEVAEKYLKKGSLLYVEGKISNRSYEQDGVTKYTSEIVVENFKMLDRRESSGSNQQNAPLPEPPPAYDKKSTGTTQVSMNNDNVSENSNLDDLPF